MKRTLLAASLLLTNLTYGFDYLVNFEPNEKELQKLSYTDHFNIGTRALKDQDISKALQHLEQAAFIAPQNPHIHFNLAFAYEQNNDPKEAIRHYQEAITWKSDFAKAHRQLAKLFQADQQIDQAIEHYKQALQYNSNYTDCALTVARLSCDKERFAESISYFERYLQKDPYSINIRFEYANTLNTLHKSEEALAIYLELLKERPTDSGLLYNTAYTLKRLGRIKEAMPYYEATLKKNPEHSEAHFSLGLTYLSIGDFERGWPLYEWRWKRGTQLTPRNFSQPLWDGSSLNGKTILLHAEQGLGDTFQFIRYAKLIKEKYDAKILFASQTVLQHFISQCCPYIDQVTTLHDAPVQFDVQAPLLSLPYILKSDEETIPREIPYIIPDTGLVAYWKQRLATDTNFKVGICWQGNNKYSTPFLRAVVAAKSIKLKTFAPLSHVQGVTFYSLQKVTGTEQLNDAPQELNLVTFDDNFDEGHGRFMDTAALIKNLDLVISIDTSICHLAAAIGTPTWNLLPEPADWRWMLERNDTPWYPNMHLYRQPATGHWDSVIRVIVKELNQLAHGQISDTNNSPEVSFHTVCLNTLGKEQEHLKNLFKQQTHKLSKMDLSINDPEFTNQLRKLYLLSEMRRTVDEKIAALKEQ